MAGLFNAKIDNARVARREGRIEDAWTDFQEAVSLSRIDGDHAKLAVALKGLAQIERDRGNLDAALPCYLEAVDVARELDDKLAFAHTLRHLADLYQDIGDLDSAESCYREALSIYRAESRAGALDLANAIRPMALLMEKLSRTKDARQLWQEAERLYTSVGVNEGAAECNRALKRCL